MSHTTVNRAPAISVSHRVVRTLASVGLFGAHIVAAIAFTAFFVRIVPMYTKAFEDGQVALPRATVWVMTLSYAVAAYWYLMVLAVMAIDAALFMLTMVGPAWWSRVSWAWSTVYLVGLLVAIGASSLILSVTWNHVMLGTS